LQGKTGPDVGGDRMLALFFHGKDLTHTPLSPWQREKNKHRNQNSFVYFYSIRFSKLTICSCLYCF